MTAIETFEVDVHNRRPRGNVSFQGRMVWTRSDGFYGDSDEHVYVATDGRIFYEQGGVGSIYETLDEFRNSLEWWATDHHFQIDEDLFREVEKAVDPFLTALRRSFCSEMAFGNDKQCVAGEKA